MKENVIFKTGSSGLWAHLQPLSDLYKHIRAHHGGVYLHIPMNGGSSYHILKVVRFELSIYPLSIRLYSFSRAVSILNFLRS